MKIKNQGKNSLLNFLPGVIFLTVFVILEIFFVGKYEGVKSVLIQISAIIFAFFSLYFFIPSARDNKIIKTSGKLSENKKKICQNILHTLATIIVVLATLLFGLFFFDDRKYYFISLLVILEAMVSFFIKSESKISTKEVVIISVLCAVAVASRGMFYMLSQFKPMTAIIIISGICLGSKVGFLTGVISAFVSNFMFGQGPWTPWQMFCFGLLGLLAGIIFYNRKTNKIKVSIVSLLLVIFVFGPILNIATVLMWQENPTFDLIFVSLVMGIPFDMIHGVSTAFFLWFILEPIVEIIERIKIKYGI